MGKSEMGFGLSLLTGQIFYGRSRPDKNSPDYRIWTGPKTDVTDRVIRVVFQYMHQKAEETGYHEISIKGFGTMSFEREGEQNGS